MPGSKLTSKGQVTIPKEIRDALDLRSGDRVLFFIRADGAVEIRPETVDLNDLYGALAYDGKPVTVAEMDEGIAKTVARSFKASVMG